MPQSASIITLHATDIAQYAELVPPWKVEFRQLSSGTFQGRTQAVQLNANLLYREHWTHRTMVTGLSPEDSLMLGGPVDPATPIDWCSQILDGTHVACGYDASEVSFLIPDNCSHWVAIVPRDGLIKRPERDYSPERVARLIELIRLQRVWSCDERRRKNICRLVCGTIDRHLANPDVLNDEVLRARVEMLLIDTVADLLMCPQSDEFRQINAQRRQRLASAVLHAEQSTRIPSVPELAEAVGVSQRVLELTFRDTLGITPKRYLILSRLNQAHAQLYRADPSSALVRDIATQWDFGDLGRFAAAYRRLFKVLPSVTLERTHPKSPTTLADILR